MDKREAFRICHVYQDAEIPFLHRVGNRISKGTIRRFTKKECETNYPFTAVITGSVISSDVSNAVCTDFKKRYESTEDAVVDIFNGLGRCDNLSAEDALLMKDRYHSLEDILFEDAAQAKYEATYYAGSNGRCFVELSRTDGTEKPQRVPVKELAERIKGECVLRFNIGPCHSYNVTNITNFLEQAYTHTGGTFYGYMGDTTFVVENISDGSKSWWSIWTLDGHHEYSSEFEEEHRFDGCSVSAVRLRDCVKDLVPSTYPHLK